MIVTVVGNCQAPIYVTMIKAATGLQDVKPLVVVEGASELLPFKSRLEQSDLILSQPVFQHAHDWLKSASFSGDPRYHIIPNLYVTAFQTDICYIWNGANRVVGPMGDYHSLIALKSFLDGLSVEAALERYTGAIYEQLGYFDQKAASDQTLLDRLIPFNVDVERILDGAYKLGPFMYTVNHPSNAAIAVAVDEVMDRAGLPRRRSPQDVAGLFPEFLKQGPVWPVYPEIAARYGIRGHLDFRGSHKTGFELMDLKDFVERSYNVYGSCSRDKLKPRGVFANETLKKAW